MFCDRLKYTTSMPWHWQLWHEPWQASFSLWVKTIDIFRESTKKPLGLRLISSISVCCLMVYSNWHGFIECEVTLSHWLDLKTLEDKLAIPEKRVKIALLNNVKNILYFRKQSRSMNKISTKDLSYTLLGKKLRTVSILSFCSLQ